MSLSFFLLLLLFIMGKYSIDWILFFWIYWFSFNFGIFFMGCWVFCIIMEFKVWVIKWKRVWGMFLDVIGSDCKICGVLLFIFVFFLMKYLFLVFLSMRILCWVLVNLMVEVIIIFIIWLWIFFFVIVLSVFINEVILKLVICVVVVFVVDFFIVLVVWDSKCG